jgi:hypothetical protein
VKDPVFGQMEFNGQWFTGTEDINPKEIPPMEGSLKAVKPDKNYTWLLVRSGATKEEKWVRIYDIWTDGAANAFYDADPLFLPPGETN